MERSRTWKALAALVVSIAVAACGTIATPSPPTPSGSPAPAPSGTPDPAALPSPSPRPVAAIAMSGVPRASAPPAAAKTAATSITAFGLDLYRSVLADGGGALATENVVVSPTSVAFALAMVRAGAVGETASEMDDVLHASGWDDLGTGLNALERALASRDATWTDDGGKTHALALRIANAAFAQRDWAIVQGYLDAIASAFGAGLRLVDYREDPEAARKLINAWVSNQTEQRIPELLAPGLVSAANRLWLVNAVYLKAKWQIEFDESATKSRTFSRLDGSRVQVPTMSMQATLPYATGTGWKATELLYQGGDWSSPLSMTLIMPDDLVSFEKDLTADELASIAHRLATAREKLYEPEACNRDDEMICCHPYDLALYLPRFGIDTRADLVNSLRAIGMRLAFGERADFSGITSPSELYISAVIHQANIDVDEAGTEAAAATAVGMSTTGGCGPSQPLKVITLRFDRPFLFVLRDVETGAILFMGRVVDPSAK